MSIYLCSPTPQKGINALPMIAFEITAKKIEFGECDTLMFTSKQAVKSAEALDPSWKNYPSVAIGSATARQIKALGGKVIYEPKKFYAKSLSRDIATFFHDKKLLYLRPKEVSFDSKGFLAKEGIALKEQIIYETSCVSFMKKDRPPNGAIIIFTSPSTIRCFLKNFEWDASYTAVVIGEATKKHLPPNASAAVAFEPTIDASIAKAKELLISNTI